MIIEFDFNYPPPAEESIIISRGWIVTNFHAFALSNYRLLQGTMLINRYSINCGKFNSNNYIRPVL